MARISPRGIRGEAPAPAGRRRALPARLTAVFSVGGGIERERNLTPVAVSLCSQVAEADLPLGVLGLDVHDSRLVGGRPPMAEC